MELVQGAPRAQSASVAAELPHGAFRCDEVGLDFFARAPNRHVFERTLDVSPEHLFEIFEDENSWPSWAKGIARVDWTSPRPFGVGTTRTVSFVGGMQVFERFIAWEPGAHMAFHLIGATQRVWWAFGEDYRVEDLGAGRCKLRWTVAYEPRFVFGRLQKIAAPLMDVFLGRAIADGLVRYCRERG